MKTLISAISNKEFPESEKVSAKTIRKSIFELIQKDSIDFNKKSFISFSELNHYRQKYLAVYLINEVGELSALEEDVLKNLTKPRNTNNKDWFRSRKHKVYFWPTLGR